MVLPVIRVGSSWAEGLTNTSLSCSGASTQDIGECSKIMGKGWRKEVQKVSVHDPTLGLWFVTLDYVQTFLFMLKNLNSQVMGNRRTYRSQLKNWVCRKTAVCECIWGTAENESSKSVVAQEQLSCHSKMETVTWWDQSSQGNWGLVG